jgi:GNAT superfamily N-acetyltransferase
MFKVEEANINHASQIVDFQLKMAWETESLKLDANTLEKGVLAVFNKPDLGKYYIVTYKNKVVGSLLITFEWSDWRNKTIYWIQSVYVVPEYRKKGVFKLLHNHIKEMAEKNENIGGVRLYVDLTNKDAIEVYNKVGMDGSHYQLFEQMK